MFENSSSKFPFQNISFITDGALNITDGDCQNSEDSTAETTVKVLAYVSILLVSVVGNALVILVIYKDTQLRTSINYFVLNMAVSDLFPPLTIMPMRMVEIISGSTAFRVNSPLVLGNILCKLCHFLPDVSVLVSIESLLLMSVDRFIAVVFPLKTTLVTSKVRVICISCTWLVAIAVYAPLFYTLRLSLIGNKTYECKLDWGPAFDHEETHKRYVTATFITFTIVPLSILVILYSKIACTLKRTHTKRKSMFSRCSSRGDKMNKQIFRLSVAIVLAFVACVVPMFVQIFVQIFLWHFKVPPICAFRTVIPFISSFMLHSWSAMNPCICFIFSKNYQRGLKQIRSERNGRLSMQMGTTSARKNISTSSTNHLRMTSFRTT